MIKLVVFDLDGVLVETRQLHFLSLNKALEELCPEFVISETDHFAIFDGLPTNAKLAILNQRGMSNTFNDIIWKRKQEITLDLIQRQVTADNDKIQLFKELQKRSIMIGVASNAIYKSITSVLARLELLPMVDFILSNQDVSQTKPSSEIYLRSMIKAKVSPHETCIIEDSHVGRLAALRSGAHVIEVVGPQEVTSERILSHIASLPFIEITAKWIGRINVLIPMAGDGSRFAVAGYDRPKPLILVDGKKTMIELVIENLQISPLNAMFIFIVRSQHLKDYGVELNKIFQKQCLGNYQIVSVDHKTEGAACSALLAEKLIDNDCPLLMANSDQYLEWNANEFYYALSSPTVDAGISTFTATDSKWSFVELDQNGFAGRVAEKDPISDIATTGIYYWKHGSDFCRYTRQMIDKNIRVNGEFYVCPVFNEAIKDGKKVRTIACRKMWGLGVPNDLKTFQKSFLLL